MDNNSDFITYQLALDACFEKQAENQAGGFEVFLTIVAIMAIPFIAGFIMGKELG
jgi:hypothetical protein